MSSKFKTGDKVIHTVIFHFMHYGQRSRKEHRYEGVVREVKAETAYVDLVNDRGKSLLKLCRLDSLIHG